MPAWHGIPRKAGLKKKCPILGGSGGFLGTTLLPKVFSHPTLSDPYNSLSSATIVTRKVDIMCFFLWIIVGKYPEDRPIWWSLWPFFWFWRKWRHWTSWNLLTLFMNEFLIGMVLVLYMDILEHVRGFSSCRNTRVFSKVKLQLWGPTFFPGNPNGLGRNHQIFVVGTFLWIRCLWIINIQILAL